MSPKQSNNDGDSKLPMKRMDFTDVLALCRAFGIEARLEDHASLGWETDKERLAAKWATEFGDSGFDWRSVSSVVHASWNEVDRFVDSTLVDGAGRIRVSVSGNRDR